MKSMIKALLPVLCLFSLLSAQFCSSPNKEIIFSFNKHVSIGSYTFAGTGFTFSPGLEGNALSLSAESGFPHLSLADLPLDSSKDFTVQFWMKTASDKPTVLLSQKDFTKKGITTQKNPGWALYTSHGTLGWCIGSGKRRINYERDNGKKIPLNDGNWHQVAMTYSKALSEVRLYCDGHNIAAYTVGFEFKNNEPLLIGTPGNGFDYENDILPEILVGAQNLQAFVDSFNRMGAGKVLDGELLDLIVGPEDLFDKKMTAQGKVKAKPDSTKLKLMTRARRKLYDGPYTVYQNRKLTVLKPISKLYTLRDGKVSIVPDAAREYTRDEQLHPADFTMDRLLISGEVLSADDVMKGFNSFKKAAIEPIEETLDTLTVGVWNIWHGGIHWSPEKDGWDSRLCIVEMLQKHDVDVVLMQETYSNGDFIAAELGWYFATTSDWDYCFQGSNISVISRFPIKELHVLPETEFNNVAVKLVISETREIYAMSNWYGMRSFPDVYAFNEARFAESDRIPVFFGGDFNAVPHTDGGKSPASVKLLANGFTDAYRSLYPDVNDFPGKTHRNGRRIDQLYYKGKGVKNTSTQVVSDWPSGFPSDHFLIVSKFQIQ